MKKLVVVAWITLLMISTVPIQAFSGPTTIFITPAAPKFTDAERQAELAKRRAAVESKMAANSVMILFSAEPKLYTNDVNYVFRQENDFYYLTNLKQAGATLVIKKDAGKIAESVFLPKRDPENETWNGKMYSNGEAATISGIS